MGVSFVDLLDRGFLGGRFMMLIPHQLAQNIRLLGLTSRSCYLGVLRVCVVGAVLLVLVVRIVPIALFFQDAQAEILENQSKSQPYHILIGYIYIPSMTSDSNHTHHLNIPPLIALIRIIQTNVLSSPSLNLPLEILICGLHLRKESRQTVKQATIVLHSVDIRSGTPRNAGRDVGRTLRAGVTISGM